MAWYNSMEDLKRDIKKGAAGATVGAQAGAAGGGGIGAIPGAIIGGVIGANVKGADTKSIQTGLKDAFGGLSGPKAPKADQTPIKTAEQQQADFIAALDAKQKEAAANPVIAPTIKGPAPVTAATVAPVQQITPAQVAAINAPAVAQIQQVAAPTAATINQVPQEQVRADQQALIQQLQGQVAGTTLTPSQIAQKQAFEQALASQYAVAASQPFQAGTMRNTQRNIADIQGQQAAASGLLKLQEQQQAQEQLGNQLGAVRTSDIGLATSQANLQQGANLLGSQQQQETAINQAQLQQGANLLTAEQQQEAAVKNAEFAQQGVVLGSQQQQEAALADALYKQQVNLQAAELAQQLGISQAQLEMDAKKLGISMEQYIMQLKGNMLSGQVANATNVYGIQTGAASEAAKASASQMGGLVQGASALAAAYIAKSDERAKTDIKKTPVSDLAEFFKALTPKSYKYKDPANDGAGNYAGFMAQDIENTKLGKDIVQEKDGVKMIDNQKLLFAMAAQIANLTKEAKK